MKRELALDLVRRPNIDDLQLGGQLESTCYLPHPLHIVYTEACVKIYNEKFYRGLLEIPRKALISLEVRPL